MGVLFCIFVVLCIFFVRDVFLLGSTLERAGRKLALYSIATSLYLFAAVALISSLPASRAAELLRSSAIWVPALAIHGILLCAAVWLRRRPHRDAMWIITLTPAPVLVISVVIAAHGSSDVLRAGLILSATWLGAVLVGVLAFRALYQGWRDDALVGDLAVIAGWTGIWILPLSGVLRLG
jgi:hypothetical protein